MIFGTLKRDSRVRHSLTTHLILGIILLQSERLPCILGSLSVAITGTGDSLHIPVMLKVLSVRNVMGLIKLRTIDCWLDIVRPILSLILLERQL